MAEIGWLEIAGVGATALGLFIAYRTFLTNRRSTEIAEGTAQSESMKSVLEAEELARQRAEEARRLVAEKKAKPKWPEIIAPGIGLDRNVIGREGDVATLRETLTGKGAAAITPGAAVLKARGGMGKTTLARFYIQTFKQSYFGIWWLRAQAQPTVIEDLNALGSVLQIGSVEDAPDARAKAVLVHLQAQKQPWLLVYDNAEKMQDLRGYLPEGEHLHILLTSREGNWPARFAEQPADALPPDQAIDLLYQESGRSDDAEGARALVAALDHLPLAIVAAGAWLRDVSESFAEYQDRLAERITEKPDSLSDYPDSVFGAIKLSLDKLSDDAALLMKVFCWLSPDELWPGLVTGIPECAAPNPQEFWDDIPDDLMTLARDGAAVDKAFAELKARSLMDREGQDHWKMHRLTQAVQQGLLRAVPGRVGFAEEAARFASRKLKDSSAPGLTRGLDEIGEETPARRPGPSLLADLTANDTRAIAAAMLAASYPFDSDFRENWPICARLDVHVAALANDPPATAAMDYLLNQASIYLDEQRMDERALRYAEESLRLKESRLGKDHEAVGIACNNLALRYWRLGRVAEAEAMAARAVGIAEANGVENPESYARRLSTHGVVAEMVGRGLTGEAQRDKLGLAERRAKQVLEIEEPLYGRQHREIATDLNNLANLHGWQGKWDQAIAGHGEKNLIERQVLGEGDPQLAAGMTNLAGTLLRSGRARQRHEGQGVLDLLEEALEIYEDAFDRVDHPDRVETAHWLASAHLTMLGLEGEGFGVSHHRARPGDPDVVGVDAGGSLDYPVKPGNDETAPGNDGNVVGDHPDEPGDDPKTVQPSAERAAELCRTYGLDLEQQKAKAADFVARARAHAAGEVVLGDMQLQDIQAERISDKLLADWEPRAAYETLAGDLAPTSLTDAYRAQEFLHGKWVASRGAIAGRKIALASEAMQQMVGIDHPVAGVIFANDVHETGAEVSVSAFRHLGLEYELAFELGRDVAARVTAEAVLDLVARVRPAFELIEDKDADYAAIDVKTMVADNAWCGGIVLGDPIDGWCDLELGALASVLSQDGVADEAGNTGAADPVNSLVWTLNHFTGRGAVVKAGEVVITGSVLRTRFPVAGDRFRYEISGQGAVEASFVV